MNAGDVFLTPDHDDHVWLVISEPRVNPDKLVVVAFWSWHEYLEQTCIIEPGEHSFIKHRTIVHYGSATPVRDSVLEHLKASGKLKLKDPLSAELLTRIRRSAEDSDNIPTGCYEVLREQGFVT